MRHDVMVRSQEWEQRVQTIANERARKSEEKAAKEAAAEERRKFAENVIVLFFCIFKIHVYVRK